MANQPEVERIRTEEGPSVNTTNAPTLNHLVMHLTELATEHGDYKVVVRESALRDKKLLCVIDTKLKLVILNQ